MICVVHAPDTYGHCWDKEQDRENVLGQVARQEDICDAGKDINDPGKEDEVPKLKAGGGAINLESLIESGHIDIDKVLHGLSLLARLADGCQESQNLFCVIAG